jgi:hypothetical protein
MRQAKTGSLARAEGIGADRELAKLSFACNPAVIGS